MVSSRYRKEVDFPHFIQLDVCVFIHVIMEVRSSPTKVVVLIVDRPGPSLIVKVSY